MRSHPVLDGLAETGVKLGLDRIRTFLGVLDEPGAGLDPLSTRRLDELILRLRDSLGSTFVIVTHELASIFAIANHSIFLDTETRTQGATGDPKTLRDSSDNQAVRLFLNRGEQPDTAKTP